MRLRNNPQAKEILSSAPDVVIQNPKDYKGEWQGHFSNKNQIHIEIGIGKGQFISEKARQNPNINYIGIEKYETVLVYALKRQQELELPNLKFLCEDASDLKSIFDKKEVSKLYLNFSDPWPKKRHAKRRLTYRDFLEIYSNILADEALLEFKTDNRVLFESSIIQCANYEKLIIEEIYLDLHQVCGEENIETEYENKYKEKGPIYKLVGILNKKEK